MKQAKIILALLLVMVMGMSIAGCAQSTATTTSAATTAEEAMAGDETTSAASDEKDVWRIGVAMNWLQTEQYTVMMNVFQQLVDADPELEIVSIADANDDLLKQVEQAESIKALGVDCWVIIPASADNMVDFIHTLYEENAPVVCVAQGKFINPEERIFVGSNDYALAYDQGINLAETLKENANVLYLAGTPGFTTTEERERGFKDAMATRPDITILADTAGNYLTEQAMSITEDWIQAFPDFDAIACVNDLSAVGAAEALKGAGRENVAVAGIDGNTIAYEMIRDNDYISMTMAQDWELHGQMAYQVIKALKNGEDTGADENNNLDVPHFKVDASNVLEVLGEN